MAKISYKVKYLEIGTVVTSRYHGEYLFYSGIQFRLPYVV